MLIRLVFNRFNKLLLQARIYTHSNSSLLCKVVVLIFLRRNNHVFHFFSLFLVSFQTCVSNGRLLVLKSGRRRVYRRAERSSWTRLTKTILSHCLLVVDFLT